jgi:hypothetical protein
MRNLIGRPEPGGRARAGQDLVSAVTPCQIRHAVSDRWAGPGRATRLDPLRGSLPSGVAGIATSRPLAWHAEARPRDIGKPSTMNPPRTLAAFSPTDGPFAETKEQLG